MAGSLLSKQQLQKDTEFVKTYLHLPLQPLQHSARHTAVFVIQGWRLREGREARGKGKGEEKKETEAEVREDGKKRQRDDERTLQQEENSAMQSQAGLRQSDFSYQGDWRHLCIFKFFHESLPVFCF